MEMPENARMTLPLFAPSDATVETVPMSYLERLAALRVDGCHNPWGESNIDDAVGNGPEARLERLRRHFSVQPRLVLVGEAPGYQGCRSTGVAFSSEALMLEGAVPRCDAGTRLSTRVRPWREPSATVVWSSLYLAGLAECCWLTNAFPLHPYGKGALTNRAPKARERAIGLDWLVELLGFAGDALVGAVGQQAGDSLEKAGIGHVRLRHPAYGGASEFRKGVLRAVSSLGSDGCSSIAGEWHWSSRGDEQRSEGERTK